MIDSTKNLFDAPFAVMGDSRDYTKFNVIIHSRKSPRYCSTVASCIDQKTAIRFARLPELYDELRRMVNVECLNACERKKPCDELCDVVRPAVELLKKVRDGK